MKQLRRILFLLTVAGGAALYGQAFEVGPSFGQSLLRNSTLAKEVTVDPSTPPGEVKLTDGFRFGFRFTLNTHRFLGHEVGYAYNRTKLKYDLSTGVQEIGMAIHQGFYNFLVYATPEGSKIRPFVTGGGHFANFVPPGQSATYGGGSTKFGINYGGGVKARVSEIFMIRFDIRQYHTPKPDFFQMAPSGWLRQLEASAGFSFVL